MTYISDAAFHFFVKLYQRVEEICTNDFLHSNLVTCQPQLELILQEDQSLLQVWFDLFKACDEGNEEYLIDLFCSVINNYSKISISETLKRFKEKLPRKKKQALRPSLQAIHKEKSPCLNTELRPSFC